MNIATENIREHWCSISHLFSVSNEDEYDRAVALLNSLIDEIGTDEQHPLYGLLDILGTLIHAYEEENYPVPESAGIEMLSFFIDEHGITPSDLPEIGSSESVSEIIDGRKELSASQIRSLAERFNVSPSVFI